MPRSTAAPVTTRRLEPEPSEQDVLELLYQAVPQIEGKPPFKVEYLMVTPKQADEWLLKSSQDPLFRQRTIKTGDVRRWRNLMKTERFVHYLPNGVLCFDDQGGIMLNGQHRMTALAGQEKSFGFVVFKNVPRWMFAYFDTNRVRTLKDVFHIGGRSTGPQTPSAMKLAMRYEEFLKGVRSGAGWRHWNAQKDEHNDVDTFLQRRQELQDWYGVGEKVNRYARLLVPSVMVFRFYQGLAWPDGDEELTTFLEALVTGGNIAPNSPALQLREWAKESWYNKDSIFAKRELHLALLMRSFDQHVRGTRIPRIQWAYGQPMTMPYHPKGFEVGIKNVRSALDELDREHAQ